MTDKADKVHPIIEAMARAVLAKRTGIPDCYDNMRSWADETDAALEERCKECGYGEGIRQTQIENRDYVRRLIADIHEEAKAAAKVLLSMEPTPQMVLDAAATAAEEGGGVSYYPHRFWKAMTSRARSEMGLEG